MTLLKGPVMVLTTADAQMLYQAANIGALRSRYRIGDTRTYQLLTELSMLAFQADAEPGKLPRQETASEESSTWTVQQVSRAAALAPRTVRLDCSTGELPATKHANTWIIPAAEAKTYIARRRTA